KLTGFYFDGTSLRTAEDETVNLGLVERWWREFLNRSRNANLQVIIGSYDLVDKGHTCSIRDYGIISSIVNETVFKHGTRLEQLDLYIHFPAPSGYVREDICIRDFPRLRRLHFACSSNFSIDIGGKSMPNLATFAYIRTIGRPLHVQTQLVSLTVMLFGTYSELSRQWTNLKQLLSLSPKLKKLTYGFAFARFPPPLMIVPATTDLRLQSLQEVYFKFTYTLAGMRRHILDNFELPGLVCMQFELDAELPNAWLGVDALLLRSQAPLTRLILAHPVHLPNIAKSPRANDERILSILRAAPHLEIMELRRVVVGDYLRRVLDPKDASVRQHLGILAKARLIKPAQIMEISSVSYERLRRTV
ncbi:hypothetical protein DFH11DRAFT_1624025, partial [Phellopilus nigrolimitatus]